MSSRALRKLRGDDDLNHIKELLKGTESDEDDAEPVKEKSSKTLNVFDLLNNDDSSPDCSDHNSEKTEPVAQKAPCNAKRKKKKKKKGIGSSKKEPSDADDIDKIISELQLEPNFSEGHTALPKGTEPVNIQSTLSVRRKLLNPETELRRMFGNQVVETRARNQQFRKRSYLFISPKNTWPPMTKCGIQMVVDKNENGITYFKYTHSKTNYHSLQRMFWRASHLADPHTVFSRVLELHPYHVDTLLYLSEVCRISEDRQTASELLERALFCLEKAFHPSFNVTSINCRMDYNRAENRALFVAIFRQVLFVTMKSCWKTGFELTKLLFNLSPEQDPMACLLFIDTLALKTEDYNFVIKFVEEFDHSRRLSMLPNFAYSIALANFYKEVVERDTHIESDRLLQSAILKYPMVANLICEKSSCIIQSNSLYVMNENVMKEHTRSLLQQCKLYIERAIDLWKDPEVASWLKRNIDIVNNNYSTMDEYPDSVSTRKNIFLSPPLNVMRHIFMADISAVSALLPTTAFDTSQDPHDPMPPPNSYADYLPETSRNFSGNPVMAFLNSLMPGYNTQNNQEFQDNRPQGVELGGFLHPAGEGNNAGGFGEQFRNVPGDFGVALRGMIANLWVQNNGEAMPEVIDEAESEDEMPEDVLD